jgi:hypothetical protein
MAKNPLLQEYSKTVKNNEIEGDPRNMIIAILAEINNIRDELDVSKEDITKIKTKLKI